MDYFVFDEPQAPDGSPGRACRILRPVPGLPGVSCDVCGKTWADTLDRVPIDLPDGHPLWTRRGWPVPPDELDRIAADVKEALHLEPGTRLLPGTRIGRVRVKYTRAEVSSFEWPAVHTLLVTEETAEGMRSAGLTGWSVAPAVVMGYPGSGPAPVLHQLFVEGSGGPAITDPPVRLQSSCPRCGCVEYDRPPLDAFAIDELAWDGTDFFRCDPPFHGFMFVTGRAVRALTEMGATNFAAMPVGEFVDFLRRHRLV